MKCCQNVEHAISGDMSHGTLVSHRIIPADTRHGRHGLTMATGPHPGPESWPCIIHLTANCILWTAGSSRILPTADSLLSRIWHCTLEDDFNFYDDYTTALYVTPILWEWVNPLVHFSIFISELVYLMLSLHPTWHSWPHCWQNMAGGCRRWWPSLLLQCSISPAWNFYEIGWSKSARQWNCPTSLYK